MTGVPEVGRSLQFGERGGNPLAVRPGLMLRHLAGANGTTWGYGYGDG